MKQTYTALSIATMLTGLLVMAARAQAPAGGMEFEIRNIRQAMVEAPSYGGSSSLGGRSPAVGVRWLRVEVQFDSRPEWADDVTLKYFVLLERGRNQRLFAGEVNHVNVERGTHYSAMFMHPNAVKRFGDGRALAVAVQLFHQNRLVDQRSEPPHRDRWWEQFSPVSGFLLAPHESPWAPIANERYEAIKLR